MLVDQTIGEVSAIALIAGFDVVQSRKTTGHASFELPQLVQSMGLSLWRDGSDYPENSYIAYELKPVKIRKPTGGWIPMLGSCRLPVIINEYLTACTDTADEYHKDGITAGFLCYPVDGIFRGEPCGTDPAIPDALRDAILEHAGADSALPSWEGPPACTMGIWISSPGICSPCWMRPGISLLTPNAAQGIPCIPQDVGTVRLWEQGTRA